MIYVTLLIVQKIESLKMKIKKLIIEKRKTPNDLDYLFTKIQACSGNLVLELRLINKFIKKLKQKDIPITETNFIKYLEKIYPRLEKEISKFDEDYINNNFFNKLKIKFNENIESSEKENQNEENLKEQDKKVSKKDNIFGDDYFEKHHSSFLNL